MRWTVLLVAAWLFPIGSAFAEAEFKTFPEKNFNAYFVKIFPPTFPEVAATWHKSGTGWYRLNIDPATGAVRDVKVLKSTGIKALDDGSAVAFLQWKAKPHLLDHAVINVEYDGGLRSYTGSHLGR